MNNEEVSLQSAASAARPSHEKARRHIPNLVGWIVLIVVILMLAGIALPVYNSVNVKGPEMKALANARQIGMELRLFAGDHDGEYPRAGLPAMLGGEVKTSNAAFAVLFPTYVQNETLFGNKLSAYQTRPPDNVIDSPYTGQPVNTLEPGENVYSYVAGLNDSAAPNTPLVAEGTDGTGHYTTDAKKRSGLWEGKRAILIHLDNSGTVETLTGPDHARYIPRHDGESKEDKGNLLDVSGVGPDVRLLDPAVNPR